MSAPLLRIEDLRLGFGGRDVVGPLNLDIAAGERVALVGESGSGKTQTALAILRLSAATRRSGRIVLAGEDLQTVSDTRIRQIRGKEVAMIFQEPMSALNPLFTIGNQIIETLTVHEGLRGKAARARALELLTSTGLRDPQRRIDAYPHQLSGGQRQRAMIAMALACSPRLLIADEPTTALDVTIRARIVRRLLDLQRQSLEQPGAEHGMAVLLITHDLALVRNFAQRVVVMEHGRIVEVRSTDDLFANPQHPYTQRLLGSRNYRPLDALRGDEAEVLRVRDLAVSYPAKTPGWRGVLRSARFKAVDRVSLHLRASETLGIVGESGSGKSSLALAILGLIRTDGGTHELAGAAVPTYAAKAWRGLRARLQVVFQDPFGSLSPRQTIEQIVGEGLGVHHRGLSSAQHQERVLAALVDVGLGPEVLPRYPHEFSGGQRQRIAIARALVLKPQVLVLDEPTSALDVSIQQQVLDLLLSLQRKYRLSYLLISHDLSVVRALSHRIAVMKDGQVVETGDTRAVLAQPQHDYTRTLLAAST